MIPTVAAPGLMTPGQFGPTRTLSPRLSCAYTRSMSWAGMPSVMQTTRSTPLASPSRIASAAKRGGTRTMAVFAPVASTASSTVWKTGMPSTSWPALPGVTPATTWVP